MAEGDLSTLKAQVAANPDDLKLRQDLAQKHFEIGEFESAIEVLKPKAESLTKEGLMLLGKAYLKLNDTLNEHKVLEQLTVNYPKFAPGFVLLGDYFFRVSQAKNDPRISMNCLAAYKSAIELNPSHRPAYDGLLKAYEKYKNFYELRILLGDMTKRFGKSAQIMSQLCRRNTIDGFFVNGRKACMEAIALDTNNPDNFVYLALIENNEGDLKRADNLLKKASAKFSNSEFTASNYADFLTQQKNLPGAENYFRLATKADPKSFRAQIGLAQTSFVLKHYEPALEAFKEACAIYPHLTYRLLRKSADLLRHRDEKKLEQRYTSAMERCLPSGGDSRTPAVSKEEYRSPFALYSKNKIPE
jgi:tetratricopeptide (TPR) repeat protein